jgi:hypothetical protein
MADLVWQILFIVVPVVAVMLAAVILLDKVDKM